MTQILPLNTTILGKELDRIQLERAPLKTHTAASLPKASRIIYAGMIARVLLADGNLNEHQSRGFRLLLNSLDLSHESAHVFAGAVQVNTEFLKDFFDLIDQHKLKRSFIVDAIVLCRLDGGFELPHQFIFAELFDALSLSPIELETIQSVVACILDLNAAPVFGRATEFDDLRCWHEFLYRPLTHDILSKGIYGGFWCVDNAIQINTKWQLEDAYCRFTSRGSILSETQEMVKIEGSHLYSPLITFQNSSKLEIRNSTIQGDYTLSEKRTAIIFRHVREVIFDSVNLNTKNARAIYLYLSVGRFENCKFIECGHQELIGGAIAAHGDWRTQLNVTSSTFKNCIARIGGAIKADFIDNTHIKTSDFIHCSAIEIFQSHETDNWTNSLLGGGGLHLKYSKCDDTRIVECTFEHSSVNLGSVEGSQYKLISKCKFNQTNVTYECSSAVEVTNNSIFINSDEVKNIPLRNQLETQAWWSHYE